MTDISRRFTHGTALDFHSHVTHAPAYASKHFTDAAAVAAIDAIRRRNPDADPVGLLPDVHPARIPRHVAIIMDGNGRWATSRGMPRAFGHQQGAASVKEIVSHAGDLGVEVVTLYSFSLENWKRPKAEVEALMQLCLLYLASEEPELIRKSIRFRVIGRREGLPSQVVEAIKRVENSTRHGTRATLCLAINYGSRAEITDAVRSIAADVRAGLIDPSTIDESTVESRLHTTGLPDPDLLIRTAGEMRLSNYLLWQISYAEIYITGTFWPDFRKANLDEAIRAYAQRDRRFGAASPTGTPHA